MVVVDKGGDEDDGGCWTETEMMVMAEITVDKDRIGGRGQRRKQWTKTTTLWTNMHTMKS